MAIATISLMIKKKNNASMGPRSLTGKYYNLHSKMLEILPVKGTGPILTYFFILLELLVI